MRTKHQQVIIYLLFAVILSVSYFVIYQSEILNDLSKQIKDTRIELFRFTELSNSLLYNSRDINTAEANWIDSHMNFNQHINRLQQHNSRRLLSADLNKKIRNSVLIWNSSKQQLKETQLEIKSFLSRINLKRYSAINIHNILNSAKNKNDRVMIIACSNLISKLESFDGFAMEMMEGNLSILANKIDHYISYLKRLLYFLFTIMLMVSFALIKYFHAIINRKEIESKELVHRKQLSDTANQAKSDFLSTMSHEIRTPMNAILGFSDILSTMEQSTEKIRYIQKIQLAGEALLTLINNILDLSKIESGKIELQNSSTSIANLFEEVRSMFSQKISDKALDFEVVIAPNIPSYLWMDKNKLRQILINLVGNAVKFTHVGHIRVIASIYQPDPASNQLDLIINIEDSGKGIAEDQLDKVFIAFKQAEGQSVEKFAGTGLGLNITRKLIEKMNGEISVESTIGKGSTFSIVIKNIEITKEVIEVEEFSFDKNSLQFYSKHILIADDIDYNREILQSYLNKFPFTLYFAKNGIEVIECWKKYKPGVVLLDMKMPEMDGYQAARELRKLSKDIIIIAVTASAFNDQIRIIRELCDGYLQKPVSRKQLISELMKYIPYEINTDHQKLNQVDEPENSDDQKVPAKKELDEIIDMANCGYMDDILCKLSTLPIEYSVFCKEIQKLALEFKDEEIIKLLEAYKDARCG